MRCLRKREDMSEIQENRPAPDVNMLRKANIYFFSKVGLNLLLIALGALFIGLFLTNMQTRTALKNQRENSTLALAEAVKTLDRNAENAETLTRIYHEGNQMVLDDLSRMFSRGLADSLRDSEDEVRSEIFTDLASTAGSDYLYLMGMDGRIILSPDPALWGKNPAVTPHMTQENINAILKGTANGDTIMPVLVKNQYGTFYFYSAPYSFNGEDCMIVTGRDSSGLDGQIESLKDVGEVLGRSGTINNGFLFAADRTDKLFVYYKNGDDLLTGQNAILSGLSAAALQDGYSGTETINGEKYECVSRAFGSRTVIVAAARQADILENDRYVLVWSILGFNIVMFLSLAYAIIVRNDFVRRAVETDRVVLRSHSVNPVYFDKSVFKRVFPLMFSGALFMYGISYYTQTLLEITEGIAQSEAALQEVIGRYEESAVSRQIIQDYYNERFISAARLISFMIEEDPGTLNEPSVHYHYVYDEFGNKDYLPDDEGNRLKSVSSSARLKELCEANDIDAVYVFDEDGRTIATSTENWFFTLSHDENDQSYPFLKVLDGREDSYIQEHMTNDLGDDTQFFGVGFNYYTKKGEDGETVYVSRSDYERAFDTYGREADGITKHRALVQIELDEDLAAQLLESTSLENILSSSMLSGGAIVMFDNSDDHICLYSPVAASIGRSAADLGVSPRAFSVGDYYGFTNVNAVSYFQCYRYLDGYYIATAVPKTTMFQSRNMIALLTAGICLALILILTLTITLTNKEEETLYASVSEEQEAYGLNSRIFNIILPSGHQTTTVKAAARWDNRHIPWNERSPEQKLGIMVSVIFGAVIIYLGISLLGINTSLRSRSIIRYIISGEWDRSVNIFALSACALVLTAVSIIVMLFRIPVRLITALLGTRGETIGHLLLSVMKYGGAIGALFYCLHLVGIDSNSLLASAGVLSLVIGLGAQSLIKDILAGIFIVFEGEFRVGDIVTISDYRGTVMDIGLRTTKIMAPGGNIKIFNNSDISGVLNMTKETSVAWITIDIEYGQDIDYVEAVLNRDLPELKEKNPNILDGPSYVGVTELGASGVKIGVMARCFEKDIKGVNRFLNKEVLQIFYKNGINVPFPNMTVSNLDVHGRKTIEDFVPKEEEEAEDE